MTALNLERITALLWAFTCLVLVTIGIMAYRQAERTETMLDEVDMMRRRVEMLEERAAAYHPEYAHFLYHLGYSCKGEYILDSLYKKAGIRP